MNELRSVSLAAEGLPHLRMDETGRVYNPTTGFVYKQPRTSIQIFSNDPYIKGYVFLYIPKVKAKYFGYPELDNIPDSDKRSLDFINCPGYCVTRDGRIYSYKHCRFLNPVSDNKGYLRVAIYDSNFNCHKMRVHRLVALAFIPNSENKEQINHIDGNKKNNCVDNLEWVTNDENKQHAVSMRIHKHAYSDEKVREVCELLQSGMKENDVVALTGVTKCIVSYIRRGGYNYVSKDYDFGTSRRGKKWALRQRCFNA